MKTTNSQRIAVVTGANKGIGLEICRQLLQKDVKVVLTARDETRGKAAVKKLQEKEDGKNVIFHQLDVADSASVASLKDFIHSQFGRLDILVNNAGIGGVELEAHALIGPNQAEADTDLAGLSTAMIQPYEKAKECIDINYYGTKRMCEAFIPLLEISQTPRIVNLSSVGGRLQIIPGEEIKKEMRDTDNLTEERLNEIIHTFLNDFKQGRVKEGGWPTDLSAYKVSKVSASAYTRIIAKKNPKMCINCVHPGYVITDITWNTGLITAEKGAEGPVMLALLPDGSLSGQFYDQTELSTFE